MPPRGPLTPSPPPRRASPPFFFFFFFFSLLLCFFGAQYNDTIPASDLSDGTRNIWIVTTASLPWMTGTAVNPLLRAAWLTRGRRDGGKVILLLPWLDAADQQRIYMGREFSSEAEQVSYLRKWVSETAKMRDAAEAMEIRFYPARYHPSYGSIFPMGDIMQSMETADADPQNDMCVLEEPEHLNWYRFAGESWKSRFAHVVGVMHTNYLVYSAGEAAGRVKALLLLYINQWMCRAYCDRIIKLSSVLQDYALEKETVCNVHGVRSDFVRIGEEVAARLEGRADPGVGGGDPDPRPGPGGGGPDPQPGAGPDPRHGRAREKDSVGRDPRARGETAVRRGAVNPSGGPAPLKGWYDLPTLSEPWSGRALREVASVLRSTLGEYLSEYREARREYIARYEAAVREGSDLFEDFLDEGGDLPPGLGAGLRNASSLLALNARTTKETLATLTALQKSFSAIGSLSTLSEAKDTQGTSNQALWRSRGARPLRHARTRVEAALAAGGAAREAREAALRAEGVFSRECYFIGKAVWAKGHDRMMDLMAHAAVSSGLDVRVDVYGSGPDRAEIERRAGETGLRMVFCDAIDHAALREYKVLVNPSVSEVLCTTVAEALAMGKWVVCARHPSNAFFEQFDNCLQFETFDDFAVQLERSLTESPRPLPDHQRRLLTWEAATERFVDSARLTYRTALKSNENVDDLLYLLHRSILDGETGDAVRAVLGAGTVSAQTSFERQRQIEDDDAG